jgi:hypothetical protein
MISTISMCMRQARYRLNRTHTGTSTRAWFTAMRITLIYTIAMVMSMCTDDRCARAAGRAEPAA